MTSNKNEPNLIIDFGVAASEMTPLEPRIMLDAAAIVVGAEITSEPAPTAESGVPQTASQDLTADTDTSHIDSDGGQDSSDSTLNAPATNSIDSNTDQNADIIVVDTSISNYQTLVNDLIDSSGLSKESVRVLELNPDADGIAQISAVLSEQTDISGLYILSHADSGELQLGTTILNNDTLTLYSNQLQSWQSSLTENADILLYGCNIADSDSGIDFVNHLSELTSADIAASSDLTGSSDLGGDWQLEYATGSLELINPLNNSTTSWEGLLITVDKTVDTDVAIEGDTLNYTVVVENNDGVDYFNVTLSDILDPNTTLVPGSVSTSPIALNDNYETLGNTTLEVGTTLSPDGIVQVDSSVFANDIDFDLPTDDLTITSIDTSGTLGNVVMNFNEGTFVYTPPTNITDFTDTFTYTVTDIAGLGSTTATVSIDVSGTIWHVDNSAAPGGDGSAASPFDSLSDLNFGGDPDNPGDIIILHTGNAAYTTGIALENGQSLVGEGTALNTIPIGPGVYTLTLSGVAPVITTAGTDAINVSAGDAYISGLTIGNTNSLTYGIYGFNFGNLTIDNVTINGTGGILGLSTGFVDANFNSLSTSDSLLTAVSINNLTAGSNFVVDSSTSIIDPSANSLVVHDNDSSFLDFGAFTVTDSSFADSAFHLYDNSTSTINFESMTINQFSSNTNTIINSGTVNIENSTSTFNLQSHLSDGLVIDSTTLTSGPIGAPIAGWTFASFSASLAGIGDGLQLISSGPLTINGGVLTFSNITVMSGLGLHLNNMSMSNRIDITDSVDFSFINSALARDSIGAITLTNVSGDVIFDNSVVYPSGAFNTGADVLINNTSVVSPMNLYILNGSIFGDGPVSDSQSNFDITMDDSSLFYDVRNSFFYGPGTSTHMFTIETTNNGFAEGRIVNNSFFSDGTNGILYIVDEGSTHNLSIQDNNFFNLTAPLSNIGTAITITAENISNTAAGVFNIDGAIWGNTFDNWGTPIDITTIDDNGIANSQTILAIQSSLVTNGSGGGNYTASGDSNIMELTYNLNVMDIQSSVYFTTLDNAYMVVSAQSNNITSATSESITLNQIFASTIVFNETLNIYTPAGGFNDILAQGNPTLFKDLGTTVTGAFNTLIIDTATAPTYPPEFNVLPLTALLGENLSTNIADSINVTDAQLIFDAAKAYWSEADITPMQAYILDHINIVVTNLSDGMLADFHDSTIYIDVNAANYGWFVDTTPLENSEYAQQLNELAWQATSGDAAQRMDLLTVLNHEIGHALGMNDATFDINNPQLMAASLTTGMRLLPALINTTSTQISQTELNQLIQEAAQRWIDTGLTAEQTDILNSLTFSFTDLDPIILATYDNGHITIDSDANGIGWFIDQTPGDNIEFSDHISAEHLNAYDNSAAYGKMDLLTTIMHEMGHALGAGDGTQNGDLMSNIQTVSTRFLPSDNVDFSSGTDNVQYFGAPILVPNLRDGDSVVITFSATVNAGILSFPTDVVNETIATGTFGMVSDTAVTTIIDQPDLVVTKSDGLDFAEPNDVLIYDINIQNLGVDALDVFVIDTIPFNTTFNSDFSTPGWTMTAPDTYQFDYGNLNHLATDTIQIAVTVDSPQPINIEVATNVVTIDANPALNDPDYNLANNIDIDIDIIFAEPDLIISKTVNTLYASLSNNMTYEITVDNIGTQHSANTVITETVPNYASFNPATSSVGWVDNGGGVYTYTIAELQVNDPTTIFFGVTVDDYVPPTVMNINNTISVTDDLTGGADPNPLDNIYTLHTPITIGTGQLFAPPWSDYFSRIPMPPFYEYSTYIASQLNSIHTLYDTSNIVGARTPDRYDPFFGMWDYRFEHMAPRAYSLWPAYQPAYFSSMAQDFPGITPHSALFPESEILFHHVDKFLDHDMNGQENPNAAENPDNADNNTDASDQPQNALPNEDSTVNNDDETAPTDEMNSSAQYQSFSHQLKQASQAVAFKQAELSRAMSQIQ